MGTESSGVESERELAYNAELRKELLPDERVFLESEQKRTELHHERMAEIVASMREQLQQKPILLIDAVDQGTAGKPGFFQLNSDLLNLILQIQTGQNSRVIHGHERFTEATFRYMLGFGLNESGFTTKHILRGELLTEDPSSFSLIVGTGGEVDVFNTQEEYKVVLERMKEFYKRVAFVQAPVLNTCATHQIYGQVLHELSGGEELIVSDIKNQAGEGTQETGVVEFSLSNEGQTSRFTKNLPKTFSLMSSHGQYLTEIPKGAVSLARNNLPSGQLCQTQVLQYANGIGNQAHPEFSSSIIIPMNRLASAQAARESRGFVPVPLNTQPTYLPRETQFPEILLFAKQSYEAGK